MFVYVKKACENESYLHIEALFDFVTVTYY